MMDFENAVVTFIAGIVAICIGVWMLYLGRKRYYAPAKWNPGKKART